MMKKKTIFMIIILFLLIILTSCSQETIFNNSSNSNSEQDRENDEFEKLINELSMQYDASIFSDKYKFGLAYSIEIQENIKDDKIVVKNVLLNDIYEKDDKIYAGFGKFGFRTIFFILELSEDQKNNIINEPGFDYFDDLNIVLKVKEVEKPELIINAVPMPENKAVYDIDFNDNTLVVSGTLIDYLFISKNDFE